MQVVSIGPLVFAGDRLAAIAGIGAFMIATSILSSRLDSRVGRWSTWALLGGLIMARLGHVIEHAASFAVEPWRVFAVWQGGFSWLWGAAGIALVSAALVRTRRAAIGAVASLVIGLFAWNVVWQLTSATPSTPMPEVALERAEGGSVVLTTFVGKPVVVNLWASWCPPCRREMPMMAEMAAARDDVTFLFVNQGEKRTTIEGYLNTEKITLSNVLLDVRMDVPRHYATPGLPVTLFIGANGKLRSVHVGEISREALTGALNRLLSE
ncbi:TlpA disulfide reductase family protein [Microvirga arabica]|uniref:TlpA disulfide reductase family protein n=1 Tax=Microvirga arabica TaxID=1128671 RepID=UPI00193A7BB2|nr:TlpA disulfide reductase family protein [Microvirga arabica]MBM1172131.1 TlpA family protein disulfide reductase [Microvirga arabica]